MMSSRTSAHTGVAISKGCWKLWEIAMPICGLARNDLRYLEEFYDNLLCR